MIELVYDGPHDAVAVPLPDGREVVVEREGKAQFPPSVAESLLEQEDNWRLASAAKVAKKRSN